MFRSMAGVSIFVTFAAFAAANGSAETKPPPDSFNSYLVRASEMLVKDYGGKGYDIRNAYSHLIKYGDAEIKPSNPPFTMCVAAMAELIITAINLYSKDGKHSSETEQIVDPYKYFPAEGWRRMRPKDIRSHIWVAAPLQSYGTADALITFGAGRRIRFSELTPGSFVNLNRTNKTGHAVMFLSYLDAKGNLLSEYSDSVAGFRYFSAQGKGPGSGFGYRDAFFTYSSGKKICPSSTPDGIKRDCGVIYSLSQHMLNTGYMLHPTKWDGKQRDDNLKALAAGLYQQTKSRGPSFLGLPLAPTKSAFDAQIDQSDVFSLNPKFNNANVTTDD